eukprot:1102890_1
MQADSSNRRFMIIIFKMNIMDIYNTMRAHLITIYSRLITLYVNPTYTLNPLKLIHTSLGVSLNKSDTIYFFHRHNMPIRTLPLTYTAGYGMLICQTSEESIFTRVSSLRMKYKRCDGMTKGMITTFIKQYCNVNTSDKAYRKDLKHILDKGTQNNVFVKPSKNNKICGHRWNNMMYGWLIVLQPNNLVTCTQSTKADIRMDMYHMPYRW